MSEPKLKPQVKLEDTQQVITESGNLVVAQGFILRKVSKFITGTSEDTAIPIEILYDVKTGIPLMETVPAAIREELEEFYKNSK